MSYVAKDMSAETVAAAEPAGSRLRLWSLASFVPALTLFLVCAGVRVLLHSGFILGDDTNLVAIVDVKLRDLSWGLEQVNLRFGAWGPYLLSARLFGMGELGFFMPTWIVSSSFASVAYLLLRRHGYSTAGSVFGGLFVGLSPFEVLIGTSFANDIFLAGAFAYAYLAWQYRDDLPKLSGTLVATLLWFAFFNKVWAAYVAPFLGIAFLADVTRRRRLAFWSSLVIVSVVLHGATAYSYMRATGDPVPWMHLLPAHYPVPPGEIGRALMIYPDQILFGDADLHTTLFGVVPYVWLLAFCLAVVLRGPRAVLLRDRFGTELFVMWFGIFFLINFVPNYYSLKEYHSAPRIFRYLTPISFFLSLHAAKLLLDCARRLPARLAPVVAPACAVLLLAANVVGAVQATAPGRENRRMVDDVVATVAGSCPPVLLIESWQGYFFRRVYLRGRCDQTRVIAIPSNGWGDAGVENMLRTNERDLPAGSMLVTGLGGYVYYACWGCLIQPEQMKAPMAEEWELVKDSGQLTIRPTPVDVKVWRWRGRAAAEAQPG